MQKFAFDCIGTHLEILIESSSSFDEEFSRIEKMLNEFEQKFSRFIEGNWLYHLNIDRSAVLDHDGKKMLEFALKMAYDTNGYFDPTVGKRLSELGYGPLEGRMKNEEGRIQSEAGKSKGGDYRDIELVEDRIILHKDISLEFGGVGKGYLIDMIVSIINNDELRIKNTKREEQLQKKNNIGESPIKLEKVMEGDWSQSSPGENSNPPILQSSNLHYLINFGGDLYGKGSWNVGLENPLNLEEVIGVIVLEDHFFACSSGSKRKWGNHHHLIDPHSGESARDVLATYIEVDGNVEDGGMLADSYATALSVMPFLLACETLAKHPSLEGVILASDGRIYRSEGSRSELFV